MQLKALSILLFVACFMTAACSETRFTPPTSTSTATLTDTPEPTRTIGPTATFAPFRILNQPTWTPTWEIRTGTPVADWHGIPIMPDAIAGEEAIAGEKRGAIYRYFTKASQDKVKDYYVKTMQSRGWKNVQDYQSTSGDSRKERFIEVSLPNNDGGYSINLTEIGSTEAGMIIIEEAGGVTRVMILLNSIMLTPSEPA